MYTRTEKGVHLSPKACPDQLAPKQVVELPVVVPKVGAGAEAGGARAVTGEDDNAPRPAPRPGDSEFEATPGLKERPGAGPGHWSKPWKRKAVVKQRQNSLLGLS
eukprot:g2690.t1